MLLLAKSTSISRPHLLNKQAFLNKDKETRQQVDNRVIPGEIGENLEAFETAVKREADRDSSEDEQPDDERWRREEWMKQNNGMQSRQDPILARQQEFDRWLQKRGSTVIDQDPEAARVAAKQAELQELLQQLYEAEAAVKMETGEVSRTQQVAQEAQVALEDATNKVRMLSADLQSAQEAAAAAAMRAHTAQLQLSAHDQLMFTARQRVDALSAQMVSIQAELAAAQQAFTLSNSSHLLEAQGRGLENALMQQEKFGRQFNLPRGLYPDNIGSQSGIAPPISSNLLEDKQGETISMSSLPSVSRHLYNYMYP